MKNYKEILKDDWDLYIYAIKKYNPDDVSYLGMNVKIKEELLYQVKLTVREDYESICPDEIHIENDKELERYIDSIISWEGEGIYDIVGFESGNFAVSRIDTILESNLFNIDLNELVNLKLIEQKLNGKVYIVHNNTVKFIVVDDSIENDNSNLDVFSVLEDAGIELKEHFMRDNFYKRWYADVYRLIEVDLEKAVDILYDIEYLQPDIYYVSQVYN